MFFSDKHTKLVKYRKLSAAAHPLRCESDFPWGKPDGLGVARDGGHSFVRTFTASRLVRQNSRHSDLHPRPFIPSSPRRSIGMYLVSVRIFFFLPWGVEGAHDHVIGGAICGGYCGETRRFLLHSCKRSTCYLLKRPSAKKHPRGSVSTLHQPVA